MIPQDGDHFAHPIDDPDLDIEPNPGIAAVLDFFDPTIPDVVFVARHKRNVIAHNRAVVVAIAGEEFASSIFGIPSRDRRDEDRAQEARRGARAMRERAWWRFVAGIDPHGYGYPVMTAAVRAFVPLTPSGEEAKRFLNSLYGWRLQR